jgi:hypothetical protein
MAYNLPLNGSLAMAILILLSAVLVGCKNVSFAVQLERSSEPQPTIAQLERQKNRFNYRLALLMMLHG